MAAITINGATPESLGISSVTIREATLSGGVATLPVKAETYDEDSGLAHDAAVTIALGGTQIFKGRVRKTPRSASSRSEGYAYEIRDAWDQLDRLPFQELKTYNDGSGGTVGSYIGEVTWEADIPLGQRISQVLAYGAANGVELSVGTIATGIPWYRATYKDRTCGEVLREIMRLMPDHQLWLDNREATPVMNMTARSGLSSISYDITAGTVMVSNDITSMEADVVSQVVLRYEKPVTVDGAALPVEIITDAAPALSDGRALDALTESISIRGSNSQYEYAPVTVAPIPQPGSASDADIVSWFIDHTPSLAALAEIHTKAAVAAKLTSASSNVDSQNIWGYTLKVIADGITRPPLITGGTPVTQTTDPADYPNELIEGSLPVWAGKRYRPVQAQVTLGIAGSTTEAGGDLDKALLEIFTALKTFGSGSYYCANFSGTVVGTNATTKNYSRLVSYDAGEEPPTGIAAALLAQLSVTRHNGSLVISGEDADITPRVGRGLNLTGGRTAWETMNEIIQEVEYDLDRGKTSITFGPPEQLGATDLVERLRAARRNTYSPPSALNATDGVGGTTATPNSNFTVDTPPKESSPHPWKVTDAGDGDIFIDAGLIMGYYMSYSSPPTWDDFSAGADSNLQPDSIVLGPGAHYDGGTHAITGTQYIYAEIPRNGPTKVYAEAEGSSDVIVEVELADDIEPTLTDTATIVLSESGPSDYLTTTAKAAVCIAKVVNDSGTLTITPYVTHNPTVFIPVVNVLNVNNS